MSRGTRHRWLTLAELLLTISGIALAQAGPQNKSLFVNGHAGEVSVIQINGRTYVDLVTLSQIINGSLAFQGNRIVLTLPAGGSSAPAAVPGATEPGFSREFRAAAIEAIASMREWVSTLAALIEDGYPVGNAMARYRSRAEDSLGLASTVASTDADRTGLQLLINEFNNVQTWSNNLVNARNSMSAANMAMSDNALRQDPLSQKILRCGQYLGPMLASGKFQDDEACH